MQISATFVHKGWLRRTIGMLAAAMAASTVLIATVTTPAHAANVIVTPNAVAPGGSVTVSGVVPIPGCPVPGNAIVLNPFSTTAFVVAPFDATGHFTVNFHVSSSISPGRYTVLVRCVGRNETVGPTAGGEIGGPFPTFTVIGLARTGGSIGPLSDTAAAAIAFALVTVGIAAVFCTRRRNVAIVQAAAPTGAETRDTR